MLLHDLEPVHYCFALLTTYLCPYLSVCSTPSSCSHQISSFEGSSDHLYYGRTRNIMSSEIIHETNNRMICSWDYTPVLFALDSLANKSLTPCCPSPPQITCCCNLGLLLLGPSILPFVSLPWYHFVSDSNHSQRQIQLRSQHQSKWLVETELHTIATTQDLRSHKTQNKTKRVSPAKHIVTHCWYRTSRCNKRLVLPRRYLPLQSITKRHIKRRRALLYLCQISYFQYYM